MQHDSKPGSSHPLGATLRGRGANFSLFSRSASRVELVFSDRADDAQPSRTIELDPSSHRTYHYWHAFVPGVKVGQLYGYRVHGPSNPACGMRFDPTRVLLDPYGRGVAVPPKYNREAAEQGQVRRPGHAGGQKVRAGEVLTQMVQGWDGLGDRRRGRPGMCPASRVSSRGEILAGQQEFGQ